MNRLKRFTAFSPLRLWNIYFHTRVKFALICSWDKDWRMLRQSWAVVASDSSSRQPGSSRVRLMLLRIRLRLKWSFLSPSCKTTRETLTFSRASLVSLMAEMKGSKEEIKKHFFGCLWKTRAWLIRCSTCNIDFLFIKQ